MIGPRPEPAPESRIRGPGRPGSPERQSGFTLLEIIVVLVIGALMYALILGVPFRGGSVADLKYAARMLASGLRQAQTTAMVTRRDAVLTLDMEARQYLVAGDAQARSLPRGIEMKLFTAQSEITNESKGAIRFYPDGSSTGGRITVLSGERKYLVDVDWLTGRVSITD
jgi:general secretion pathway protein H